MTMKEKDSFKYQVKRQMEDKSGFYELGKLDLKLCVWQGLYRHAQSEERRPRLCRLGQYYSQCGSTKKLSL